MVFLPKTTKPSANDAYKVGTPQVKEEIMLLNFPLLRQELETRIRARTGSRLRKLDIELSPERVVLHGETATFHVKQLAQHGIREVLPDVTLQNDIVVL